MKRTAIYMRVSTVRQAREGESLGFQSAILHEYVHARPDLVLVGEYVDDGVSGTKFDKRDELQRMLTDVRGGKIDLILFTKLDRFFRSVRHLMNTLDTLERYGVEWKAIQENHDSSTPTGKLAITIMGAFAQMESDMDSVRIKDAFAHKRSKKEWLNNNPPYGFMLKNKRAVADPERAEIARKVFKDYIRHGNISKILRDYSNVEGFPRSMKALKVMLTNTAYIGEKYGIEGYTEQIIDRNTFDTVQRLVKMNVKQSQKHDYIFTGLLICPECGRKMNANQIKGQWGQYRCRYRMFNQCNYIHTHSERKIEKYLLSNVREDLEGRYLHLKEVKKTDNSQKINSLYRKMDRLKDLYVNELIDLDVYKSDLEKYKSEIAALERPQETNTEHIEALLQMNVYEIYQTLSNAQKRRLWRSVVKSITPKDGSFFVEYL